MLKVFILLVAAVALVEGAALRDGTGDLPWTCMACEWVADEALKLLEKESTEAEILVVLEGLCDKIPIVGAECHKYIAETGPSLIKLVEGMVSADKICQTLQLCPVAEESVDSHELQDYYQMGPDTLRIPNKMFKQNRERICAQLNRNWDVPRRSIILLQGGDQKQHYDSDSDIDFQQEAYFMWLFGVMEADFYGAIYVDTCSTVLFMPRLPASYATWMGELKTPEYFKARYGVDMVLYTDEISNTLEQLRPSELLIMKGTNSDSKHEFKEPEFVGMNNFEVDKEILYDELAECRVIKSHEEMKVMRYVNTMSGKAHKKVMRMMKPGRMEYEGEATFKHYSYMKGGMRFTGYTCICASGPNSAVLHYGHAGEPNNRMVQEGDMMLFDMGAEYAGYTADLTVSFPATGKFTSNQKFVYRTCLKANRAVIAAMKPGVSWPSMHRLAEEVILKEFLEEGLLFGTLEDLKAVYMGAVFMPHGLGHLIGLNVHDVGGYVNAPPRIQEPGIENLRTARTLLEGMVITVEPGVYFGDALLEAAYNNPDQAQYMNKERIEEFRGSGGVRIEDGVAVTWDGTELLSNNLPRTVEEIEAFMAGEDWQ